MILNADKVGPLVTQDHDPRITKIGKLLRPIFRLLLSLS